MTALIPDLIVRNGACTMEFRLTEFQDSTSLIATFEPFGLVTVLSLLCISS